MNITKSQHANILGYAVIAYGVYYLYLALGIFWVSGIPLGVVVWPQFFSSLFVFAVALAAGYIVQGNSTDAGSKEAKPIDPKLPGLLFVFLSFGSFPLGTLISAYMLLYLFVIRSSENLIDGSSDASLET